jgi:hypothetical protein
MLYKSLCGVAGPSKSQDNPQTAALSSKAAAFVWWGGQS